MRELPKRGEIYKYFKGGMYLILDIATHTETGEKLVAYLDSTNHVWVRPLHIFMGKVDRDKYPYANQEYRFEYYSSYYN